MREIELKFIEIDAGKIREQIKNAGAELINEGDLESTTFMKDNFDRSDSSKHYLRVRKEYKDTKVTYKSPADIAENVTSREEIEINVDDYESAISLFQKLGFTADELFIKHREHYELGDWHYEIDTVPGIPTYLEVEAQSEQELKSACIAIGLDIKQGRKGTIFEIYSEKKISPGAHSSADVGDRFRVPRTEGRS